MRRSSFFLLLLSLTSTHCGSAEGGGSTEGDSPAGATGGGDGSEAMSCPHPRIKTEGEWPLLEQVDSTFYETLVSSEGEDSFRTLSCGVENSARQPSFQWTAPYFGSFFFSYALPDFSLPSPIIALAVLSGDCTGEELACRASTTTRVGFDLELSAGEQVTVLMELDERVGDSDMDLSFAIADSEATD